MQEQQKKMQEQDKKAMQTVKQQQAQARKKATLKIKNPMTVAKVAFKEEEKKERWERLT